MYYSATCYICMVNYINLPCMCMYWSATLIYIFRQPIKLSICVKQQISLFLPYHLLPFLGFHVSSVRIAPRNRNIFGETLKTILRYVRFLSFITRTKHSLVLPLLSSLRVSFLPIKTTLVDRASSPLVLALHHFFFLPLWLAPPSICL